jgi:hypothetical protein
MEELIVNTYEEMEPEEIGWGEVYDYSINETREIAVKCIRKATLEEYLAFVNDHNLLHMVGRDILQAVKEGLNFYVVKVLD